MMPGREPMSLEKQALLLRSSAARQRLRRHFAFLRSAPPVLMPLAHPAMRHLVLDLAATVFGMQRTAALLTLARRLVLLAKIVRTLAIRIRTDNVP